MRSKRGRPCDLLAAAATRLLSDDGAFEPDASLFLDSVKARTAAELEDCLDVRQGHPMPDLVVEIDRSVHFRHKLVPYFRMGVSEAWTWDRRDGVHLWIPAPCSARHLRESGRSRVLPGLGRDDLDWLLSARTPSETSRHSRRLARQVARALLADGARPSTTRRALRDGSRRTTRTGTKGACISTESRSMNEETFNLQIRKFLKKVGVTSQREIEKAVRDAMASGTLSGDEKVQASVTLRLPELGVELDIDDRIALE